MLARLGFMTRAYKARVGPLDTISTIPIRSFFTRKPDHRRSWVLQLSLGSGSASSKFVNERILTEGFELPEYRPNRPHPYPSEGRRVSSWSAPVHGKKTICHANRPSTACRLLQDSSYRSRCRLLAAKHLAMVSCGRSLAEATARALGIRTSALPAEPQTIASLSEVVTPISRFDAAVQVLTAATVRS